MTTGTDGRSRVVSILLIWRFGKIWERLLNQVVQTVEGLSVAEVAIKVVAATPDGRYLDVHERRAGVDSRGWLADFGIEDLAAVGATGKAKSRYQHHQAKQTSLDAIHRKSLPFPSVF